MTEFKLDYKDKRILFELDTNSRQSYQQIARKVKLSKDAVFYRIKNLEKEGIIQKYQTIIDVGKVGYTSYRIFFKLRNVTTSNEEEIIQFLKQQKCIVWIASVEGYWDINTWMLIKNVAELEAFWQECILKYQNYIEETKLSIFTDITYFSRGYFLSNTVNKSATQFVTIPTETKVDAKDKKILQILNLHARTPIVDISKKVKLSPKQIVQRIRNLEKKRVIVGYRVLFNLTKLGYTHYHLCIKTKDLTREKAALFHEFCFNHPNILYDHHSICGPDIELDIEIKNVEMLREIIHQMKDMFASFIQDYDVWHYLKEHKYNFIPVD